MPKKCYLELFYFLDQHHVQLDIQPTTIAQIIQDLANGPTYVNLSIINSHLNQLGIGFHVSTLNDYFILTTTRALYGDANNHYFSIKFNNRNLYHVQKYEGSRSFLLPCRPPSLTAKSEFDRRFVAGID